MLLGIIIFLSLIIQYFVIIIILLDEEGISKDYKSIKTKKTLFQYLIPFCWVYFCLKSLFKCFMNSLKELD